MKLSVNQAIDLGSHLIPTNRPFLLIGPPGVGKTDAVKQMATANNRRLFISHPAVDDPTDYKGVMWFNEGEAHIFPVGVLKEVINCKEPAIWFIDDIGQAPIAVQNGLMQFIHHRGRQLGDHKIPDHIAIVAATNRREDNAGVVGMTDPLKGRWVTMVEIEASVGDWQGWALTHDINPLIIAYIHYRPGNLSQFEAKKDFSMSPTPRGWEHVNELLKVPVKDDLMQALLQGAIGEHVATEFMQFKGIMKQLPDLDDIERFGENVEVPSTNQAQYAIVGALSVRGRDSEKLRHVMNYMRRLPAEYRVLWSELWAKRNENMLHSQEWTQWALEHSEILTI